MEREREREREVVIEYATRFEEVSRLFRDPEATPGSYVTFLRSFYKNKYYCKLCGDRTEYGTNHEWECHFAAVHRGWNLKECWLMDIDRNRCKTKCFYICDLVEHVTEYHRITVYSCPICEDIYYDPIALQNHACNVHTFSHESAPSGPSSSSIQYICDYCPNNRYRNMIDLLNHYRTLHLVYPCTLCDHVCDNPHDLTIHKNTHYGTTQLYYHCELCPRRVRSRRLMYDDHYFFDHTIRPYLCGICHLFFPSEATFKLHYRILHQVSVLNMPSISNTDYDSVEEEGEREWRPPNQGPV